MSQTLKTQETGIQFVSKRDLANELGISSKTLEGLYSAENFPPRCLIGMQKIFFRRDQVEEWKKNLPKKS